MGQTVSQLKERYVKTGAFNTRYWEAGEGPVVIMLHGGGAGADGYGNFKDIVERFADAGYRGIALDQVGFGKSDKPDPETFAYTADARATQLLDFIDALVLKDVTLIGNSMGGSTSLTAALKQPEKMKRLILMGTGGRRKPSEQPSSAGSTLFDYEVTRDHMYKLIRNLTNEEFEVDEDYLDYRLELTKDPENMAAYRATMKVIREGGLYIDDELLSEINHNTLLFHGKNDRMVPVEHSYEFVKHMPNAWLYVMPHCGHWAMLEHPEEFTRICIDFIKNH